MRGILLYLDALLCFTCFLLSVLRWQLCKAGVPALIVFVLCVHSILAGLTTDLVSG